MDAELSARELFIAWERLRVPYNLILAVPLLFLGATSNGPMFLAYAAITTNVAFCAGPVGENYLTLLRFPRQPTRWLLFGLGTLLALVYILYLTISWSWQAFD